jgi:hypothetical protein
VFFAVKSPITDEEGNIIGLLGTSIDLFNSKEKLLKCDMGIKSSSWRR